MGGWKKKGAKQKGSRTIDVVSYALEVSLNGVTCMFVVHFRSSDTFLKFVNWLNSKHPCVYQNV